MGARAAAPEPTVVAYVTGHGFGHATRTAALLAELRRQRPGARVVVRTSAPERLFSAEDPALEWQEAEVDVGVLQPNGLEEDWPRTLAAHEAFLAGWEERAEAEAGVLRRLGAGLVVADIPPLAFDAARRAGVPSAGVSNFSWDWLFEPRAREDARWGRVVEAYRRAHGLCDRLFQLPFGGVSDAFARREEAPLLARRPRIDREEMRRRLGLAGEARPAVLVSFGGLGSGKLRARDDLRGFLLLGFGPAPEGLRGEWRELGPLGPGARNVDVAAACELVLGKPGYGTVAECLALGLPMLFVPRRGNAEAERLAEGLLRLGLGRELPPADFAAGRWRAGIEALLREGPRPPLGADGDRVVARKLLHWRP